MPNHRPRPTKYLRQALLQNLCSIRRFFIGMASYHRPMLPVYYPLSMLVSNMKKFYIKWLAIVSGLFITMGVIVPWVISNDVFPVYLMIFFIFSMVFVWMVILEKPALRFLKWANKQIKELDK